MIALQLKTNHDAREEMAKKDQEALSKLILLYGGKK